MLALLDGLRFETELAHESCTKLITNALELLEERLCLTQQLLAGFSLDAGDLRFEPSLEPGDALFEHPESLSVLGAQCPDQRLRFAAVVRLPRSDGVELLAHVCFEDVRAMAHVVLKLRASVSDVTIQSGKTPFELDEDVSEENVANALEACTAVDGMPHLGRVDWLVVRPGPPRPWARRWFGRSLRFFLFRHARGRSK